MITPNALGTYNEQVYGTGLPKGSVGTYVCGMGIIDGGGICLVAVDTSGQLKLLTRAHNLPGDTNVLGFACYNCQ